MSAATPVPQQVARLTPLWVALFALLGGALYLWRIGAQGLWLDEAVTALRVTQSLGEIWRADPFTGPLHEVLLHFWVGVFGTSEAGLRSLSALFAAASIPLVYLLARRLTAVRPALIAIALFAVSPFTIFFAQEARPYALLMLLTIAAMLAFERAVRTRTWGAWIALALLNAALLYTHFYALFVVVVQAGGLRLLRAGAERIDASALRSWLLSLVASLALFAPRIPALVYAASHTSAGHHALAWAKVPFTFLVFAVGYNAIPMNADTRVNYLAAAIDAWPFLAAVVVGFGGALLLGIRAAQRDAGGRFLFWWCFLPAAVVLLLAEPIPAIAAERYFVITFPAFVMLIALGLTSRGWLGRGAGLVVALVVALSLFRYYVQFRQYRWKDDWPTVVAMAEKAASESVDRIVFLSNHAAPAYCYYAPDWLLEVTVVLPPDASDARTERLLAHGRRRMVCVVESITHPPPESSRPLRWLRSHAERTGREWQIPWGEGERISYWAIRPGTQRAPDED